ncbi:early activation antigen CD69-like isoform X2 [Sceloporus undulatus]|uniref:early activation antigen CD69-like isoform X2 n=1 Tax=Sceloporus undulatus TaxID=8520 RepID=UPI001C4D2407|nr:early activation antigen CD69-like isoform X2 [Sceloporus undulatus]
MLFLSLESVTSDQSYENASVLEYESDPFSGLQTRKLMQEGVKMEPASVMFLDEQEGRAFGKKHFIIFCVVLFCCLVMVIVALVMASLRCFYKCPSGWLEAKRSCYRNFTKPNKWNEGRHMCRSLGADLIVIEEEKEQDFLNYKMHAEQNSFWIGLYNVGGKPWKWVDGTDVSYQGGIHLRF